MGTNFGRKHGIDELHVDPIAGVSVVTREPPMQVLLGHPAWDESLAQLDRMSSEIEARHADGGAGGRIQYMLANEPGRIIVKYRPS
jgi:hypothetical protein